MVDTVNDIIKKLPSVEEVGNRVGQGVRTLANSVSDGAKAMTERVTNYYNRLDGGVRDGFVNETSEQKAVRQAARNVQVPSQGPILATASGEAGTRADHNAAKDADKAVKQNAQTEREIRRAARRTPLPQKPTMFGVEGVSGAAQSPNDALGAQANGVRPSANPNVAAAQTKLADPALQQYLKSMGERSRLANNVGANAINPEQVAKAQMWKAGGSVYPEGGYPGGVKGGPSAMDPRGTFSGGTGQTTGQTGGVPPPKIQPRTEGIWNTLKADYDWKNASKMGKAKMVGGGVVRGGGLIQAGAGIKEGWDALTRKPTVQELHDGTAPSLGDAVDNTFQGVATTLAPWAGAAGNVATQVRDAALKLGTSYFQPDRNPNLYTEELHKMVDGGEFVGSQPGKQTEAPSGTAGSDQIMEGRSTMPGQATLGGKIDTTQGMRVSPEELMGNSDFGTPRDKIVDNYGPGITDPAFVSVLDKLKSGAKEAGFTDPDKSRLVPASGQGAFKMTGHRGPNDTIDRSEARPAERLGVRSGTASDVQTAQRAPVSARTPMGVVAETVAKVKGHQMQENGRAKEAELGIKASTYALARDKARAEVRKDREAVIEKETVEEATRRSDPKMEKNQLEASIKKDASDRMSRIRHTVGNRKYEKGQERPQLGDMDETTTRGFHVSEKIRSNLMEGRKTWGSWLRDSTGNKRFDTDDLDSFRPKYVTKGFGGFKIVTHNNNEMEIREVGGGKFEWVGPNSAVDSDVMELIHKAAREQMAGKPEKAKK